MEPDMIVVHKQIITDKKSHQPVAVVIDYEDWLEIERLLLDRPEDDREMPPDLSKYEGFLTLTEDPLEYQRRIRDEWT
jgi:hypothetical protein